jgi:hypothetical protein
MICAPGACRKEVTIMRRLCSSFVLTLVLVTAGMGVAHAQFEVFDPLVTAKEAVIAGIHDVLTHVLDDERALFLRMATRLSALTDLAKYVLQEAPAWRIHLFMGEEFLYANPYNAALNYGDGSGTAYEAVARPRQTPGPEVDRLAADAPEAYTAIRAALATLDLADSAIIAGTDQTGQLRYNGRKEGDAIVALETDVVDPASDQSATAVLDKISGASLISTRQQQARIQFATAIVEQLLVDNKRDRDTETTAMNMQFGRLRNGAAASTAVVSGAADDLRAWRLP